MVTYKDSLIYGAIFLPTVWLICKFVIEPWGRKLDNEYKKRETMKLSKFKSYEKYDKIRDFVDKEVLSIDSNKLEVLINTVSKLKEHSNWLKSEEAFFLVKKERLRLIKKINEVISHLSIAYSNVKAK